jgi:methylthioribose-1-phosphate isomerase
MTTKASGPFCTIEWIGDIGGCVRLLDQTLLPERVEYLEIHDPAAMHEAIRSLRVRGAPAIGIAAAMGLVLTARRDPPNDVETWLKQVDEAVAYLASARPTAVNLFWALERMRRVAKASAAPNVAARLEELLIEAKRIRDEDAAMCRAIGEAGVPLIPDCAGILTHCNAGGLATAELGTALAPIYLAHAAGRRIRVFADETRPLLQGARLTAWELAQAGVDVTVLCDNMAAQLMASGQVQLVITGADRIAANGDTANKIGTYGVAVLAAAHDIPFYIAAPSSTFDLDCPDGSHIPIEQRSEDEVRCGFGRVTVPPGVRCLCPAFDVTPARLIRGIITERGVISPVGRQQIREVLGG